MSFEVFPIINAHLKSLFVTEFSSCRVFSLWIKFFGADKIITNMEGTFPVKLPIWEFGFDTTVTS